MDIVSRLCNVPDSNIGGASDEQIIYINDLPFRRDA